MLSATLPAFAEDGGARDDETGTEALIWQLLCRCGGNGTARTDWNGLLNLLLCQYIGGAEPEQPSVPEKEEHTDAPAAPEQPETPHTPAQPADPEQPAESEDDARLAGVSAYEQEVARLVNAERAKAGLAPLTLDAALCRTARMKSQDMHDSGYFDHNSPAYGTPFQLMKSQGITYRTAGENIAMGYRTPEAVVNAWMNSPGHRANILNASYTTLGVGYVADGSYWTQHFIG
ncbi:MAG: hypothetical protein E7425_03395 [Ruminococcaceae bacterium]|nr:hypothetical protein [Oscillospiraceae bacterium]